MDLNELLIGDATSFVVGNSSSLDWAIPTANVRWILSDADWMGPAPLDLVRWVGLPPAESVDLARIILLHSSDIELPVRVVGKLKVESFQDSAVYQIPRILTPVGGILRFSDVVVAGEKRRILIVNPEALVRATEG